MAKLAPDCKQPAPLLYTVTIKSPEATEMTLHKSDKSDSGNGCYEDYIAQLDVAEQPAELRTIESNPLKTFENIFIVQILHDPAQGISS